MKNILLIHTGGTFGMMPVGRAKTLKPGNLKLEINKYLPLINRLANIDIKIPFNLDSSDITPDHWTAIYTILLENYDLYDGFVLIHGTDTMTYTAAALSFLLGAVNKPVILTGAQRSLAELRSDAGNNLINAIELATLPIPEVAICFGNMLYRGTRTKKNSIEEYNCFESPNYPPLATIGSKIHLNNASFFMNVSPIKLIPKYEEKIISLRVYPGFQANSFLSLLQSDLKVIILESFGSGNLPIQNKQWISFIKQAIQSGISVYIGSQASHGTIDLNQYLCGKMSREAGAESIYDMTLDTAIVKLMLLLGNFKNKNDVHKYFSTSLVGELTEELS
jgi:L-asparaginase